MNVDARLVARGEQWLAGDDPQVLAGGYSSSERLLTSKPPSPGRRITRAIELLRFPVAWICWPAGISTRGCSGRPARPGIGLRPAGSLLRLGLEPRSLLGARPGPARSRSARARLPAAVLRPRLALGRLLGLVPASAAGCRPSPRLLGLRRGCPAPPRAALRPPPRAALRARGPPGARPQSLRRPAARPRAARPPAARPSRCARRSSGFDLHRLRLLRGM